MTSILPSKIKSFTVSLPFLTESPLHIDGCQNCISKEDKNTVPDFALRVTEMFSLNSEYLIPNPVKPLQIKKVRIQDKTKHN